MECKYFKELLSAYIDGYVKPEEKALVEGHLSACEECKEYFLKLKNATEILKNMEKIEAPIGFEKRVMGKIEKEKVNPAFFFNKKFILEISAAFIVFLSIMFIYMNLNKTKEEISPKILSEEKILKEKKIPEEEKDKQIAGNYPKKDLEKKQELIKQKEVREESKRVKTEESKIYVKDSKPDIPPAPMIEAACSSDEKKEKIAISESNAIQKPEEKLKINVNKDNFINISNKIEEILKNEKFYYKKNQLNEKTIEFIILSKDLKDLLLKITNLQGLKIEGYEMKEINENAETKIELTSEE